MTLDVRVPLGLLFVAIGSLLAVFGAVSHREIYARSLGINVNLAWGIVMLLSGLLTLWLARFRFGPAPAPVPQQQPAEESAI